MTYLRPSFILIHPTVWLQYTNVTDRQDRQTGQTTVAQKSISIWKSCRHGACFQLLSRASGEHVCRSQQTLNTIHSMVIVTSRTANECKFRVNELRVLSACFQCRVCGSIRRAYITSTSLYDVITIRRCHAHCKFSLKMSLQSVNSDRNRSAICTIDTCDGDIVNTTTVSIYPTIR